MSQFYWQPKTVTFTNTENIGILWFRFRDGRAYSKEEWVQDYNFFTRHFLKHYSVGQWQNQLLQSIIAHCLPLMGAEGCCLQFTSTMNTLVAQSVSWMQAYEERRWDARTTEMQSNCHSIEAAWPHHLPLHAIPECRLHNGDTTDKTYEKVFGITKLGLEPTTSRSKSGMFYHYVISFQNVTLYLLPSQNSTSMVSESVLIIVPGR